ncbi:hypothetical protein [Azospirillum melinis]
MKIARRRWMRRIRPSPAGYVLGSGHSAAIVLAKLRKYLGLSDQHLQITSLQDMRSRKKPRFKSSPDLVGL